MAVATSVVPQLGRNISPFFDVSVVPVTFTFSATTYTNGTGIAVDLAAALLVAAPFSQPNINPADVLWMFPALTTTNAYVAANLVVGAASGDTYVNPALYPFAGGAASNYTPGGSDLGPQVRPVIQLANPGAPATIRLYGTGSAQYAGLSEIATGTVTDTLECLIVIARNGPNS